MATKYPENKSNVVDLRVTTSAGGGPVFVMVRIGDLRVDHSYQRPLDGREKKMAKSFSRHRVGTLCVSRREDGSLWLVDGQHRAATMRSLGLEDERVMAEVYDGLSIADEAALFDERNDGAKRVSALDRYKARLVARDPVALQIQSILAGNGLSVSAARSRHSVNCIAAIEQVHLKYNNLGRVTAILRDWGTHAERFDGQVLKWVAKFLAKHPEVDDVRLSRKLLDSFSPLELRAEVKMLARTTGRASRQTIAVDRIRAAYNKGLRASTKLEA